MTIEASESEGVTALMFASVARRLGAAARAEGLIVPAFRSPPRQRGANRTLRRTPSYCVVAVRLRGRQRDEVIADMVDGVLAANRFESDVALRNRLYVAMGERP